MRRLAPSTGTVLLCIAVGVGAGLILGAGYLQWLVVGLVAIAFVALTWSRPELAVAALILILPVLGTRAIASVPALPDVTVGRLLVAWCVLVVGRAVGVQRRVSAAPVGLDAKQGLSQVPLVTWVAIFLGLMAIAAVRNPSIQAGIQTWLDSYLLPFAMLVIVTRYRWSPRETKLIVLVYLLGCSVWSVIALVEARLGKSFFTGDQTLPWASGGDAIARTGGAFVNPAFLGTALGIGLVLAWVWASPRWHLRHFAIASMPFAVIGLALTQTRASWLGALAGILAVLATARQRMKMVAIVAAGLALGVVVVVSLLGAGQVADRTTSTSEIFNRVIVQRAAINIVADKPFLGVGSGRFSTLSRSDLRNVGAISGSFGVGTLVPHNTVLSSAVDGGLVAGVSIVVVFGLLIATSLRLLAIPAHRHLGTAALGGIVVFCVNAMFIDIFLGAGLVTLALTVFGVLLSPLLEPHQSPR